MGKTILKSGQEWTVSAHLGQLKLPGQCEEGLLRSQLWCPNELGTEQNKIAVRFKIKISESPGLERIEMPVHMTCTCKLQNSFIDDFL